ncbi:uncharacterized protein YigE (DUF2233 family) [Flavobacterium arsenatis]|uniref:Uncharacterized protein YigE (DUF2233 family) n=1 Tax=Flavobacterium arsenatis TaxID=1484332 RepID=A0ABU1TL29_9FLAO|nr:phosphodiester glycosidase family protein [Flavobacterium arsenatis]MDR6966573.1 uncharacterized protein YigE (DUF2233 family) [Flavobacterium arsenatis]
MMKSRIKIITTTIIVLCLAIFISAYIQKNTDERFVVCIVDPVQKQVKLYWKNDKQQHFKSIQNLKSWLENRNQKLEFAMNAGMYKKDNSPQGLYIEKTKMLSPIGTASGNGNFYMKPNGVFYLTTKKKAGICVSKELKNISEIEYATQSGPMLLVEGKIHSDFKKGSSNVHIRNGVGILPDGKIVFAMSKKEINFYDFATYFKSLGCKNALYLDGFVSRTYFPKENWIQTDGNFGVIIGVVE